MDKSFLGHLENFAFNLDHVLEGTSIEGFLRADSEFALVITPKYQDSKDFNEVLGVVSKNHLKSLRNVGIEKIEKNGCLEIKKVDSGTQPVKLLEKFKNESFEWACIVEGEKVDGFVSESSLLHSIFKAYESEQIKQEELQKKLTEQKDYIAVLAHDIRSPISVISICADYLNHTISGQEGEGPDITDFVHRIKNNATKATSLVETILDLGALSEAQEKQINIESTFIPDFMEPVINDLRYIAGQKEIKLIKDISEPFYGNIDKMRFTQIVENLVNNAIKFSSRKKNITISTKMIEKKDSPVKWFQLSIQDEGAGIPKDKLETVFTKYQQLDGNEIVKESGVGLGLSIVQQYTSLHQGEISVESEEGKGATFTIMVPGASEKAISKEDIELQSKRILVVEDDEDIRYFLEMALKQEGYEVVTAKDGVEGNTMVKIFPFDAVVSDIRMPNKDGIEFMQDTKSKYPDLPFILVSGFYPNMDTDLVKNVFKADRMLRKPFSKDIIIKNIGEVIEEKNTVKKLHKKRNS